MMEMLMMYCRILALRQPHLLGQGDLNDFASDLNLSKLGRMKNFVKAIDRSGLGFAYL